VYAANELTGDGTSCYPEQGNLYFRRIMPDGTLQKFQSVGIAVKISDLDPILDQPQARYQLPEQWIYSEDGNYKTFGGTVDVVCVHAHYQLDAWYVFWRVEVVALIVRNHQGAIYRSARPGTSSTAGWAWYANGCESGNSNGWAAAMSYYLTTGNCSMYWDIWVDGEQKCKNGQRVNQS